MYKMLKSIRWVAVFLCLFLINMTVAGGYFEGKYQTSRYNRRYDYNQKPQKMQEPGGIRGITRTSSDLLEEKLRHILEIMDRGEKEGYSAADKKRLTELKDELGNLNRQIVDEFQKVEVSLIEKSVNREIVDRHREFVQEYQKNFDLLMQAIAEIPEQSVFSIRSNNTRRTGKIIEKIKNEWLPKEFNPFETNDFPQKNIKLDPGEPRLYPSFTPAYEYTQNSFFAASFDNYRVVSQDLQETVEVKLTPEIRELAAELDNNPVKIYEFVRNNFDYEPYYGSVKGAQETLWQKAGNDFDLASLLIALYRAAGIPARYVYGVVEIPLEQVKRWVGIEDSKTVVNMFATNGIPSKGIIKGGEITHLLKEHVWVEAYVPLNDYRGCRVDEHGKGWIPLDPSFKQYTETPGFDFSTEVPFDIEGFITELKNAANISDGGFSFSGIDEELIQSRLEEYQKELELYVDENGSFQHPEEIFGSRRIVPEKHSILPVSLPYKVSNVLQELASLNDNHRQKLTLRVEDPYFWESSSCVYTASIPELAGKTVSLAYVAATQADEDFLASYLPEPPEDGEPIDPKKLPSSLPAYLIRVKPQIIIDGQAVATGSAVTMGTKQDFYMHFAYPAPVKDPVQRIHNQVTAGSTYVITLNTGRITCRHISEKMFEMKEAERYLEQETYDLVNPQVITSNFLHIIGLLYFAQLDAYNELLERNAGVRSTRMTSAGITTIEVDVSTFFGLPQTISFMGLKIDVDRDLYSVHSRDGDKEKIKTFFLTGGVVASYLEGEVFRQLFGGEAVSTMHILEAANRQGIRIYTITKENVESILPKLQYKAIKSKCSKI